MEYKKIDLKKAMEMEVADLEQMIEKTVEEMETIQELQVVRVEGLVVLKLAKHCSEALPDTAMGRLLGFDGGGGVLEITQSFPAAVRGENEDEDVDADVRYAKEMAAANATVRNDSMHVGWYTSCYLGNFVAQLVSEPKEMRQLAPARSIVLVYDPVQASIGKLSLRAFRLTPEFLENRENVSYEQLFREVPVEIMNPPLVQRYLASLGADSTFAGLPSLDATDLSTRAYIERNMESLLEKMEDLSVLQRRQHALSRNRRRAGEEEEEDAPARLESVLLASQIDVLAEQTDRFVAERFSKSLLN